MNRKHISIFITLLFVFEYSIAATDQCSNWHKKRFLVKKNVMAIDNSKNEHLALMMKKRAEIILEDEVLPSLNLSQHWSYFFSSYSSKKKPKKSIDLIFNKRGILLSYKLNKDKNNDFYCLSKSMKE